MPTKRPRLSPEEMAARRREEAVKLYHQGYSDKKIAAKLKVTYWTVKKYRYAYGIYRRDGGKNLKHTKESCVRSAKLWARQYGYTPGAVDWNPSLAISRGQDARAQQFYAFRKRHGCPTVSTVVGLFGSWSGFITAAGLKSAGKGGHHAHRRWKAKTKKK